MGVYLRYGSGVEGSVLGSVGGSYSLGAEADVRKPAGAGKTAYIEVVELVEATRFGFTWWV